jgi:hypothetical protein
MGSLPPEESRLERLARLAGMTADEYREHLRFEIAVAQEEQEQVWRAQLFAAAGLESGLDPYGEELPMSATLIPPAERLIALEDAYEWMHSAVDALERGNLAGAVHACHVAIGHATEAQGVLVEWLVWEPSDDPEAVALPA